MIKLYFSEQELRELISVVKEFIRLQEQEFDNVGYCNSSISDTLRYQSALDLLKEIEKEVDNLGIDCV